MTTPSSDQFMMDQEECKMVDEEKCEEEMDEKICPIKCDTTFTSSTESSSLNNSMDSDDKPLELHLQSCYEDIRLLEAMHLSRCRLTEGSVRILARLMESLAEWIIEWKIQGDAHPHSHPYAHAQAIVPVTATSNSMVSNFLLPSHPHPLVLYESRYHNGVFRCDLCWRRSVGFAYTCDKCHYDVSPSCFAQHGGIDLHPVPIPNPDPAFVAIQQHYGGEHIEIQFPPQISKQIGVLLSHAAVERNRAILAFHKGKEVAPSKALDATIDVWLERCNKKHTNGAIFHKANSYTPVTLTTVERVALLANIRRIFLDILKLTQENACEHSRTCIRPWDIQHVIASQGGLRIMCNYINSPFTVEPRLPLNTPNSSQWLTAPADSIHIPPPHPFPRHTPYESMLDDIFQTNVEQLKQLNAPSWYFDPTKIKKYAQQYATLQLPPGDPYFYRYGVTPIAYYGTMKRGLRSADQPYMPNTERRLLSFSVPDASGVAHTFTFEFTHKTTLFENCLIPEEEMHVDIIDLVHDTIHVGEVMYLHCREGRTRIVYQEDEDWMRVGLTDFLPKQTAPTPARSPLEMKRSLQLQNERFKGDTTVSSAASSTAAASTSTFMASMERPRKFQRMNGEGERQEMNPSTATASPAVPTPRPDSPEDDGTCAPTCKSCASCKSLPTIRLPPEPHPGAKYRFDHLGRYKPTPLPRLQSCLKWQLFTAQVALELDEDEAKSSNVTHPTPASSSISATAAPPPPHPFKTLKKQLMSALQLCLFEDYPAHLWQANHPLCVRHYFTQQLLIEQSRAAKLPSLPNDLFQIIAEYEPAHLPSPPEERELFIRSNKPLPPSALPLPTHPAAAVVVDGTTTFFSPPSLIDWLSNPSLVQFQARVNLSHTDPIVEDLDEDDEAEDEEEEEDEDEED